jgi:protein-S-isoprenylcysteine O-methyltransferase Ste14
MSLSVVGAFWVLIIVVTSGYFYKHAGRPYAAGKEKGHATVPIFSPFYLFIRLTTAIAGAASFLSDHWTLFEFYQPNTFWIAGGIALSAVGLAGFIWSKISLAEEYSPCFDSMKPRTIVERGPYRLVRHPIYSSNILLLAGLTLATGSAWLLLNTLLLIGFYGHTARLEERELKEQFPAYRSYVARTWRFVPFVT